MDKPDPVYDMTSPTKLNGDMQRYHSPITGYTFTPPNFDDMDDPEYQGDSSSVHEVDIIMRLYESRFGFSVMGGADEGFHPRIDEVTKGSPADRANLEVGDEILAVNGEVLENATHAEVIQHIHKCIKTRNISLRVKRRNSTVPDPNINGIEDAYVIAVEEQAKQRLEKLSALQKVQPVDMTKIVDDLNDQQVYDSTAEVNGFVDNNPIYVSTFINKENPQGEISENNNKLHNSVPHSSSHNAGEKDPESAMNGVHMNGYIGSDSPVRIKMNGKGDYNDTDVSDDTGYQVKGSKGPPPEYSHYTGTDNGVHNSDDLVEGAVELNTSGPHREMAIDCPEYFVPNVKETPKYPLQKNSVPQKQNRLAVNDEQVALNMQNQMPSDEDLARIRYHQDELRKRREEETRLQREQEFLRTSLRGSKKLQELEHRTPAKPAVPLTGISNTAFEDDDEADEAAVSQDEGVALPDRDIRKDVLDGRNGSRLHPIGIEELFSSLNHIQSRLNAAEHQSDISFLRELFRNSKFQQAVRVHQKVVEVTSQSPPITPLCNNAHVTSQEVTTSLQASGSREALELMTILQNPNVQSLLFAHDRIAQRETATVPSPDEEMLYERASMYGEESVKIVRLLKTNDPLGATVRNEGDSVIIGRIVKGGAAEKSGLLHEGDEILEVNNIDMRGRNVNDVCDLLANMTGTLTFLIIPNQEFVPSTNREVMVHIKAHFDYDPEDDMYIPCRELGISFVKGDILHVINQDDANWWQAFREGEEEQPLAGLIPSKNFQEQREAMKQTIVDDDKKDKKNKKGKSCNCAKKSKKKKKKVLYNAATNEDFDAEEILTFEEVALYYPQPDRKRPIVLIGPPNVGRHELRQRLMENNVDRFSAAVPHTSRPRRDDENDSKDYHFVPRHMFEADIIANKFVEHGEYEKNLYGTSIEAIRQVVNEGKICVLNLHPQSLRILKNSDLKPYVVFVAPPNLDRLRQNLMKTGNRASDDELKEIIERSREMEENFGHYFDFVIVNYDMDKAYDELMAEINRLEVEPQWVPAMWLNA